MTFQMHDSAWEALYESMHGMEVTKWHEMTPRTCIHVNTCKITKFVNFLHNFCLKEYFFLLNLEYIYFFFKLKYMSTLLQPPGSFNK